ncbi:unnamed protein product [Brugia timori]|nr:unnamed protein product [Brugia timori]
MLHMSLKFQSLMEKCAIVVDLSKKSPKFQVDVCTPGERHVNGMQVNGYENPTYSFFDNKA